MNAAFVLKKEQSSQDFVISAFLYGLLSYALVFLGYAILNVPFQLIDAGSADKKSVITTSVSREIVWALAVSFGCAIINVYLSTYSIPFRMLRLIGATKRYGSEDVWDYTFNLKSASVEYVHVRDFEQKLVSAGWVVAFSETDKIRELTLRNVRVFDFEGEFFYESPLAYLARKPEGIHIEFPATPEKETSDGAPASPTDGE